MDPVTTTLMNYGAMGALLVYFIIRDMTFLKELREAFGNLTQIIAEMKGKVQG